MSNNVNFTAKMTNDLVNVAVKLSKADLPLACPLPTMELWSMHPKVYLPLDADLQATCPYCGTNYFLVAEQ